MLMIYTKFEVKINRSEKVLVFFDFEIKIWFDFIGFKIFDFKIDN